MAEKDTEKAQQSQARPANGTKVSKPVNGSPGNGAAKSGRPSVVPLNYRDKDSLNLAYMPYTKGGGLFMPTTVPYELNEEVFLLVTLPGGKKPLPVPGRVVWQNPASAGEGKQGVGIEFKGREGNALRNTIEGMLGARLGSPTPSHTM